MINLKGAQFYSQLMDLKRNNTKKMSILYFNSILIIALSIVLSCGRTFLISIFATLGLLFFCSIRYISMISDYEFYYYETFFPELLSSMGIYYLNFVPEKTGIEVIKKSGLNLLTEGNISQSTCFYSNNNYFNYFGYYKKTKEIKSGKHTSNVINFDGYFFVKELDEDYPFDFRIVDFKQQNESFFNKKGYTGKAFLNYKEVQLSSYSIEQLASLQKEFGRLYISIENSYLAIQFLELGKCAQYMLNPCLEKGKDSDDHFKIIELSKLDAKIAPIFNQVLEDVSKSYLK